VINEAVSRLPREMQPIDGARLGAALRARRDRIAEVAGRYYELLAGEVDIAGSDQADLAEVTRVEGGSVVVKVRRRGETTPYYQRRFLPSETKDIRLYLKGEADSAVIAGGDGGITVRLIGGGGNDRLVNSAQGGSARFYDNRGDNAAVGGSINTRPYQAISDTTNPTALPHRDWGVKRLSFPVARVGPDVGFMLGWAGRITTWAFRKKPYSSQFRYRAAIATGAATGRLSLGARFQRENSRNYISLEALASGIEVLRWYGFGNETTVDGARPIAFNRATQHVVSFAPSVGWALGERTLLELGPRLKYSVTTVTDGRNATRFIGVDRPFGVGNFGQIGFGGDLVHDARDIAHAARRGLVLELGGNVYPKAFDVEEPFGEIHGRVATYLSAAIPTNPTLALQVGAKKVFGTAGQIPFHEAAFLGSTGTLRGFRSNRFAGDAMVHGSAELRLHLTNAFIFVPGRQGIFGFYDRGRVSVKGQKSDVWHDSFGGGVWLAFLTPGSLVSAALGHSDEGNKIHLRVGFAY
jgi:hypothetical protein